MYIDLPQSFLIHYLVFIKIEEKHRSFIFIWHLFHQLGTTHQAQWDVAPSCFYQVFRGSCEFFLEGFRASHHGSKHSFNATVCLNETVVHKYLINTELYLTFSKSADKLLVMNSLINILKFTYFNIVSISFFRRYLWSFHGHGLMLVRRFIDTLVCKNCLALLCIKKNISV